MRRRRGSTLIKRLQQDVRNCPYASPGERAGRLGVSLADVSNLLGKIDGPMILRYRMDSWLNGLPEEEHKGGRLLYSVIMQLYEERFFKKKSSRLNLSQLSLISLPVEVLGQLSWLSTLDLSGNFLKTLVGSGISELKKLQYLDLSDNFLVNLAGGGFFGLRELRTLNLGSNLLTNVEELGEMCWLQTLILANNPTLTDRRPLQNFPESTLNLSSIDMTKLSSQIQPSSELKLLEISSEELDSPDVVESGTNICRLPEITPPGSNSHNLLPGNSQGSLVNEQPSGGNLNTGVATSIIGWENWGASGSSEPTVGGLYSDGRHLADYQPLTDLFAPLTANSGTHGW